MNGPDLTIPVTWLRDIANSVKVIAICYVLRSIGSVIKWVIE